MAIESLTERLRPTARELTAVVVLSALLALGVALNWKPGRPNVQLVPATHTPGHFSVDAPEATRINVNTATIEELILLPGIGPVRARAIVEDRQRRGPFPTVESLVRVRGIGPKTVERIRTYVTVGEGTHR